MKNANCKLKITKLAFSVVLKEFCIDHFAIYNFH
jgi:hypothetical protein